MQPSSASNQKLIEIAPSPALPPAMRERADRGGGAAGAAVRYDSLGTFEFLVDATGGDARRLRLHRGQSAPAGRAHRHRGSHRHRSGQAAARVRRRRFARGTRTSTQDGHAARRAASRCRRASTWNRWAPTASPSPPAARSPHSRRRPAPASASTPSATPATRTSPRFDSLLAKLIAHSPSQRFRRRRRQGLSRAVRIPHRGRRRPTSASCRACCSIPTSPPNEVHTRFIDDHIGELVAAAVPIIGGSSSSRLHAMAPPAGASRSAAGRSADRHQRSARRAASRQGRRRRCADRANPPPPHRRRSTLDGPEGTIAIARADAGHDRLHRRARRRRRSSRAASSSSWKR